MNSPRKAESDTQVPSGVIQSAAWNRLEHQLEWYDKRSVSCQRWYKALKLLQVVLAVLIPIMAMLPVAKWATALAGAAIAVLEAIQHMNQYSTLWVTYRSTAEHLRHEKYLFLSSAGPYRGQAETDRLLTLAERVEEHVSSEHANWFNEARRLAPAPKKEAT